MLIDRKSRPWIVASAGILLIAAVCYAIYSPRLKGATGGSWPGLIYGGAGTLMIGFAALLGLRKRFRTMRIGKAYTWTQAHVWFGLLSYPIILLHGGFHFGGGLTTLLMWLFTAVWITGIIGLILQQFMPARMMRDVQAETIFQQIDAIAAQLQQEAASLVQGATHRSSRAVRVTEVVPSDSVTREDVAIIRRAEGEQLLSAFYAEHVGPLFKSEYDPSLRLAASDRAATAFRSVRSQLPPELHETLDDLQGIVDERRQLERQRRLHRLLQGWLLIHVPLSYAMLIPMVIHIVMALRYTSVG